MKYRVIIGLMLAITTTTLRAAKAETKGKPTLPGRRCQTEALPEWTPQEKWVWLRVCEGEIANFNLEPGYGGTLDPKALEDWPESRVLTSRFLRTVLLYEPYRSAQPETGVRIIGAWFKHGIDLDWGEVDRQLWLDQSRVDGSASLHRMQTRDLVSFRESVFSHALDMEGAKVGSSLFMRDGAQFGEVVLRGAKIGGHLDIRGSNLSGTLEMDSAEVGSSLFMRDGAHFEEVVLRGAKIGDQLDMSGSTFSGTLKMDSAKVGSSLLMRQADFTETPLRLVLLSVGGNLDLRQARLNKVDLQGAIVAGELRLADGTSDPTWAPSSLLDLRYATVGSLQAQARQTNLASVRLEGFTFGALGGLGTEEDTGGSTEASADFVQEWLRRERIHSPQAHEHFASVLRKTGFADRARQTLYEGKNHELSESLRRGILLSAGWLAVQWALIGYGYRPWYAVLWIGVLIASGWHVARKSRVQLPGSGEPLGFWYSVDRLLPIVELRRSHYDVDLPGWRRVYFYFHTMMGYVLATFLLAALSGLVG